MSAVLLCKLDTFLTREEYHQLLYASSLPPAAHSGGFGQKVSALSSDDEIKPLPPAIWKPKPLWTGKQVCVCASFSLLSNRMRSNNQSCLQNLRPYPPMMSFIFYVGHNCNLVSYYKRSFAFFCREGW